MTRNSQLNTGIHNQHFIIETQWISISCPAVLTIDAGPGKEAWPRREFNQMLGWGWSKIMRTKFGSLYSSLLNINFGICNATRLFAQTCRRALGQLWYRMEIWRGHTGVGYYANVLNLWMVYGCQFHNSWTIWWNSAIIHYSSADQVLLSMLSSRAW